jgi:acetyl esterase
VATLPRLSASTEHRILRTACALPPGVQRLLFGPPPAIDGQRLASDINALLRLAALGGETSVTGGLEVEEARAQNRLSTAITGGPSIPMAAVSELEIPGPARPLAARLYTPLGVPGSAPSPLLVYFHGGGWVIGDLETHDTACRFLAARSGALVLAVDYRLAPEHPFPAAVDDCAAAFRWAERNAASLNADPSRIAVGGDSAGGNLAAVVCLVARDDGGPMPAMQLLIYPVTDGEGKMPSRTLFEEGFLLTKADMEWFEQRYLPDPSLTLHPRVSVMHVDDLSGLPPAYVTSAGFDPLRDEGEAYAGRMRAAGVPVALRRHPGLIHGFAHFTSVSRSSRAAMLEAAGALRMGLCLN